MLNAKPGFLEDSRSSESLDPVRTPHPLTFCDICSTLEFCQTMVQVDRIWDRLKEREGGVPSAEGQPRP
jgi:hypothetical protein